MVHQKAEFLDGLKSLEPVQCKILNLTWDDRSALVEDENERAQTVNT